VSRLGISSFAPFDISSLLSENTFVMLRNDGFLFRDLAMTGNYDAMIEEAAINIHPSYQRMFIDAFSRESLISSFSKGQREIEAKLYQKNQSGQYQWIKTKVIRIEDESGDVVHICFNKVLGE